MDERELRQLLHSAYDRVPPLRDPFRRVREYSDQPRARWRPAMAAALACVMGLFTAAAVLFVRDVRSAPNAGIDYRTPVAATVPVGYTTPAVAQTSILVSSP